MPTLRRRVDPADKKKLTVFLRKPAPAAAAPERISAEQQAPPEQAAAPFAPAPQPVVKPAAPVPAQPVIVSRVSFGADGIDIETGGAIGDFRAFTLREPGRLVIDIPAARSAIRSIAVPANRFGVVAARIATFEGKQRLVFDTGPKPFPRYRVEKTATGLRVKAGDL